jgi:hypothetical protein
MPSSNASPEERLRKLEQELAFVRSQGLSPDEHDRLLQEDPSDLHEGRKGGGLLLTLNFILTLGILAFLIWKEWKDINPASGPEDEHEEIEASRKEPQPFLLPSRK